MQMQMLANNKMLYLYLYARPTPYKFMYIFILNVVKTKSILGMGEGTLSPPSPALPSPH